jgi:hypothetical protein
LVLPGTFYLDESGSGLFSEVGSGPIRSGSATLVTAQMQGIQVAQFFEEEAEQCFLILLAHWVNSHFKVIETHGDI